METVNELGIELIEFAPTHFCEFWRKAVDSGFSIYFKDLSRSDVLWTVEFVNFEAKYAGCDA